MVHSLIDDSVVSSLWLLWINLLRNMYTNLFVAVYFFSSWVNRAGIAGWQSKYMLKWNFQTLSHVTLPGHTHNSKVRRVLESSGCSNTFQITSTVSSFDFPHSPCFDLHILQDGVISTFHVLIVHSYIFLKMVIPVFAHLKHPLNGDLRWTELFNISPSHPFFIFCLLISEKIKQVRNGNPW